MGIYAIGIEIKMLVDGTHVAYTGGHAHDTTCRKVGVIPLHIIGVVIAHRYHDNGFCTLVADR